GRVVEIESGRQGSRLTAIEPESIQRRDGAKALEVSPRVLSAAPSDWEALEGMRVRIAAPLTVSGTDQVERYGELTVAFDGRLWQPSELAAPGSAAFESLLAENRKRRLLLDDG